MGKMRGAALAEFQKKVGAHHHEPTIFQSAAMADLNTVEDLLYDVAGAVRNGRVPPRMIRTLMTRVGRAYAEVRFAMRERR